MAWKLSRKHTEVYRMSDVSRREVLSGTLTSFITMLAAPAMGDSAALGPPPPVERATAGAETPPPWQRVAERYFRHELDGRSATVSERRVVNATTGEERYSLVLVPDQEGLSPTEQRWRAWRAQKLWMHELNGTRPSQNPKYLDDGPDRPAVLCYRAPSGGRPGWMNPRTMEAVEAARKYRRAALADGWRPMPPYSVSEEPWRFSREGFEMQVVARAVGKFSPWGYVQVRSPYGPPITTPYPYSWDAIIAGTRICDTCGASDVHTEMWPRIGRSCETCRRQFARDVTRHTRCDAASGRT